jgi:hypothetical protein
MNRVARELITKQQIKEGWCQELLMNSDDGELP